MNATTSRFGVITDPAVVALPTAICVIALLVLLRVGAPPAVLVIAKLLAILPFALAVVVTIALSGARRRVVDWLAGLPFPVENMNGVLNGVGELLDVSFEMPPAPDDDAKPFPTTPELNERLDAVHPDSFVTELDAEGRRVELRIGVVESKRNPAVSNHARFLRVRELVERVLVPLHARHPIREVRIK